MRSRDDSSLSSTILTLSPSLALVRSLTHLSSSSPSHLPDHSYLSVFFLSFLAFCVSNALRTFSCPTSPRLTISLLLSISLAYRVGMGWVGNGLMITVIYCHLTTSLVVTTRIDETHPIPTQHNLLPYLSLTYSVRNAILPSLPFSAKPRRSLRETSTATAPIFSCRTMPENWWSVCLLRRRGSH